MSWPRPSKAEAWQRLRDADPPAWVLDHVACVERLATAMGTRARAQGHAIDEELVSLGAILHDIGRSITQDPTHAVRGALLIPEWPEVQAIVACHTGAGLDADEAAALGVDQLAGELTLIPQTWEQKLVGHADNLYSGDKRLSLAQVLGKYEAKGLQVAGERIAALHDELTRFLGVDPQQIEATDARSDGSDGSDGAD